MGGSCFRPTQAARKKQLINGVQTMKKILLAAGLAALISAPAFAAPEPFNVEVGPQGQMRASPPSQQCCQGGQQGAWAQATSQGQGGAAMVQASDEAQPVKSSKKKARRAKPPAQPAE
jgi:hypothetical protein